MPFGTVELFVCFSITGAILQTIHIGHVVPFVTMTTVLIYELDTSSCNTEDVNLF
jgi:hypothetical protein